MRREWIASLVGALVVIVGVAGFVAGRETAPSRAVVSTSAKSTGTSTSTIATTTPPTTTSPPTTTVPTATIPDAVSIANSSGLTLAESTLQQAGFMYQVERINSGACYFTSPLTGQQEWNTGELLEQNPNAGTVTPIGSLVTLQVC